MKTKNKKTEIYRQGDVMLIRVDDDRRGTAVRENGRIVLAHGEATGHAHVVEPGEKSTAYLEEIPNERDGLGALRLLRVVGRSALLKHDEHAPITIRPGTYRVRRQREYSPEEIRRVAD